MHCPYCTRFIRAMTGYQEAQKFHRHLYSCRKAPRNVVIRDGRRVSVGAPHYSIHDAMNIRAGSGQ